MIEIMLWGGLYPGWLFSFLSVTLASTDPVADKRCTDIHGPGWGALLDSNGIAIQCEQISTQDDCFPDYLNPHTGKYECCPAGTKLASDTATGVSGCCNSGQALSVDALSRTGACCDIGLHWTYDPVSKMGACCQDKYSFDGIQCVLGAGGSAGSQSSGSSSSVVVPPASPKPPSPAPSSSTSSSTSPPPAPPPGSASSVLSSPGPKPATPTAPPVASAPIASASSSSAQSDSQHCASSSSAGGIQASVSTLGASLCSMLCPSQPAASPSASPTPGLGGPPSNQIPLGRGDGACQVLASKPNWFNGTCIGLMERGWNCVEWGLGMPPVEVGSKVNMPTIGWEYPGYRPADLTTFRFPVDTWITITNYYVQSTQGRARVWADDKVIGDMSPLPNGTSDYCYQGDTQFAPCLIEENYHSRGIFKIPAGTHNVSLEWLEGPRMYYYAIRYDAVCSDITPCQGTEVVGWNAFSVAPTDPLFATSAVYTVPTNYDDDVLFTLIDAGYAASQWTLYIDGQSAGPLNRPVYLTKDHFMNDAVLSFDQPAFCFAWGAYWRVYLIPKGAHTLTMKVTGGMRANNAGAPWGSFDAGYKINKPCCANTG